MSGSCENGHIRCVLDLLPPTRDTGELFQIWFNKDFHLCSVKDILLDIPIEVCQVIYPARTPLIILKTNVLQL